MLIKNSRAAMLTKFSTIGLNNFKSNGYYSLGVKYVRYIVSNPFPPSTKTPLHHRSDQRWSLHPCNASTFSLATSCLVVVVVTVESLSSCPLSVPYTLPYQSLTSASSFTLHLVHLVQIQRTYIRGGYLALH